MIINIYNILYYSFEVNSTKDVIEIKALVLILGSKRYMLNRYFEVNLVYNLQR